MRRNHQRLACIVIVLVFAGPACAGKPETKPTAQGPSMEVAAPPSHLKGNVATLAVSLNGLTIVKADGDTSGRTGHFHVFIDRDPVPEGQAIPKEKGIVHTADNPIKLYGLSLGQHKAIVTVGDGSHKRILGRLHREVGFTMDGPAVQAGVPADAKAGQPITLSVVVQGVDLAAANGDTSGRTGHLHVFIDREPTPAGQPIPKEAGIIHTTETSITIPPLPSGEHTLWVVLGDGNHVPFDPPVMAKVSPALAG
jgi:hypothetical protein